IWCRLLAHWVRLAAARTFCTAGNKRAIRMPMMAITTKSSISVNPRRVRMAPSGIPIASTPRVPNGYNERRTERQGRPRGQWAGGAYNDLRTPGGAMSDDSSFLSGWTVGVRVWVERAGQAVLGAGRLELLEWIDRCHSISAAAR